MAMVCWFGSNLKELLKLHSKSLKLYLMLTSSRAHPPRTNDMFIVNSGYVFDVIRILQLISFLSNLFSETSPQPGRSIRL